MSDEIVKKKVKNFEKNVTFIEKKTEEIAKKIFFHSKKNEIIDYIIENNNNNDIYETYLTICTNGTSYEDYKEETKECYSSFERLFKSFSMKKLKNIINDIGDKFLKYKTYSDNDSSYIIDNEDNKIEFAIRHSGKYTFNDGIHTFKENKNETEETTTICITHVFDKQDHHLSHCEEGKLYMSIIYTDDFIKNNLYSYPQNFPKDDGKRDITTQQSILLKVYNPSEKFGFAISEGATTPRSNVNYRINYNNENNVEYLLECVFKDKQENENRKHINNCDNNKLNKPYLCNFRSALYNGYLYNELHTKINDDINQYGYAIVLEPKIIDMDDSFRCAKKISYYYRQISTINELVNYGKKNRCGDSYVNNTKIKYNESIKLINRADGTGNITAIPLIEALKQFKENMNNNFKIDCEKYYEKNPNFGKNEYEYKIDDVNKLIDKITLQLEEQKKEEEKLKKIDEKNYEKLKSHNFKNKLNTVLNNKKSNFINLTNKSSLLKNNKVVGKKNINNNNNSLLTKKIIKKKPINLLKEFQNKYKLVNNNDNNKINPIDLLLK